MVVEVEIFRQPFLRLCDSFVPFQIHVLILHAAPQALNKYIVKRPAASVHTDGYVLCRQPPYKLLAGKLTALITIEYFGNTVQPKRLVKRIAAKTAVHSVA